EHGLENTANTHRRERSGGLILCGGLSSRMGFEKARLRFPGGSLLERVLGRMREVVSPVVLSLAPGQAHPALPPDVMAVEDSAPEQGPLQGLLEGFRALDGQCGRVLVMAVDMPFFTPPWMTRLLDGLGGSEGRGEGHRACMFEFQGFVNALTAAYEMALLPKLERLVSEGLRRPIFLSRDEPARIIPIAEEEETAGKERNAGSGGHPLTDVDTPQAYREALLREGVGSPGGAEVTVDIALPGPPAREHGFAALYADTAGEALEFSLRLYPECAGVGEIASPNSPAGRGGIMHNHIMRIRGDGNSAVLATALDPGARLDPGDRLLLGIKP
ncbi:MAG: molybdenum cofactor guanylyltransferase, partial [bacterium]